MNQIEKTTDFNISTETNAHTIIYELKKFYIKAKKIEETKNSDELSLLFSELKSFIYKVPSLKTYFLDMVGVYALCTEKNKLIFNQIKKITIKYINENKYLFKKFSSIRLNFLDIPTYLYFNSLFDFMGNKQNKQRFIKAQNGIIDFYKINLSVHQLARNKTNESIKIIKFFSKIEQKKIFNAIRQSINFAILEYETYITNSYETICYSNQANDNFYFYWKLSALRGVIEQSITHISNELLYTNDTDENSNIEKTKKIQQIKQHHFANDYINIIKIILDNKNITISEITTKLNIMSEETIRNRLRGLCNIFEYTEKGKGIESVKEIINKFNISNLDI